MERGLWEDTTFWNLSWGAAPGRTVTSTICDLTDYAKGLGTGSLFRNAPSYEIYPSKQLLPAPEGCDDCPQWNDTNYYAMGYAIFNEWLVATPIFAGAGQLVAYLPSQDLSVAIIGVAGMDSELYDNYAMKMWKAIAAELSPDNIPLAR